MKTATRARVAALQMTSGPDVAANLAIARGLLEEAAAEGAQVAVLPENFSFFGLKSVDKRAVAETDGDGPAQAFLASQARELRLWIVGGTVPIRLTDGGPVAAASLVYRDDGSRAGRYDKIHLFDVDIPGHRESYRESADITRGTRAVLVPTPAGLLGLSVCYDMRFPELYRSLSAAGAQWLSIPSSFTVPTGQAHWETLLRARAIENLSYVVAPAQWGRHANGRETYGDTLIVDYWGRVMGRRPDGGGIVVADFDLKEQALTRLNFPALTHRVL